MVRDFDFWSIFLNFFGALVAGFILYSSALLLLYPESKYALLAEASADHTKSTDEMERLGLPSWCCDPKDCEAADVRLIRYEKNYPIVEVRGVPYRVVGRGQGDGREGIFTAERKTAWCHIRGGDVRCASVKPREEF